MGPGGLGTADILAGQMQTRSTRVVAVATDTVPTVMKSNGYVCSVLLFSLRLLLTRGFIGDLWRKTVPRPWSLASFSGVSLLPRVYLTRQGQFCCQRKLFSLRQLSLWPGPTVLLLL